MKIDAPASSELLFRLGFGHADVREKLIGFLDKIIESMQAEALFVGRIGRNALDVILQDSRSELLQSRIALDTARGNAVDTLQGWPLEQTDLPAAGDGADRRILATPLSAPDGKVYAALCGIFQRNRFEQSQIVSIRRAARTVDRLTAIAAERRDNRVATFDSHAYWSDVVAPTARICAAADRPLSLALLRIGGIEELVRKSDAGAALVRTARAGFVIRDQFSGDDQSVARIPPDRFGLCLPDVGESECRMALGQTRALVDALLRRDQNIGDPELRLETVGMTFPDAHELLRLGYPRYVHRLNQALAITDQPGEVAVEVYAAR